MMIVDTQVLTGIAGTFGFSTLGGFVAGYAAKKVVKIIMIIVGLGFLGLGALSYFGVISVNWNRVQQWFVNGTQWAYTQGTAIEHHLAHSFGSAATMASGGGFLTGFGIAMLRT
jgi:uncharacterized membrane protein (Fun14 family)